MNHRRTQHIRYGIPLIVLFGVLAIGNVVAAIDLNIPIGSTDSVESIGEYIQIFYGYFVRIVGILAVAMIMWGGYKWITAGGNSSAIQGAKDTIVAAIMGVILTMISFVLLNLINPELTTLTDPDLTINANVSAQNFFCRDIAGAPQGVPCGELRVIPGSSGAKCFGDLCQGASAGQYCVVPEGSDTPVCQDLAEACENTDQNNCEQTDQELRSRGVTAEACRKIDRRRWGIGISDICRRETVLTCLDGFERVNCNEGGGLNTVCFMSGSPSVCIQSDKTGKGEDWAICRNANEDRAAEYADSVCCRAKTSGSDAELIDIKQNYITCSLEPVTFEKRFLAGFGRNARVEAVDVRRQVEVDCTPFNDPQINVPYKGSSTLVCPPPTGDPDAKCWADLALVSGEGGVECREPEPQF